MQDNLQTHSEGSSAGASTNDFNRIIIKAKKRKSEDNIKMSDMKNKTKVRQLTLSNRYELLANQNDDDDMETEDDTDEEAQTGVKNNPNKSSKTKRPPPLVIHGKIKSHTEFMQALKDTIKENFHIKYHEDFTEVFTSNHEQYSLLKERWLTNKINFHTYTDKTEKRRTYVIRGLHSQIETNEIKQDLETIGYKVININTMKNTTQTKHMVTIQGNIQMKQLNHQAKYVCNTKISWEHYISKKRITQCRRCQGWGHATVNCYADPACLKCAENHLTKDCLKSKEIPAKCINCGLGHPANATICQEYQRRLKIVEQRNQILQQNINPGKSANIKPVPDVSDRNHYPFLRNTSSVPQGTGNNTHRQLPQEIVRQATSIQQGQHNNHSNGGSDGFTMMKMANETTGPALYSDIIRTNNTLRSAIGNRRSNTITTNQNNTNDLSDFLSLSNEIRELTKVFNIKKMLLAVREFKKQIQQCNLPSEQFQLLIQFCDKLDNE